MLRSSRTPAWGSAAAPDILDLITANLTLAVSGCHTAVNHYLAHARAGAIVNVSSHQAQRAVRGALPYATAKAAIEGLTRAIAVDHGPPGIRTNAVALGSISTPRYEAYRTEHPHVDAQMAALYPLGRGRRQPRSRRHRRLSPLGPSSLHQRGRPARRWRPRSQRSRSRGHLKPAADSGRRRPQKVP